MYINKLRKMLAVIVVLVSVLSLAACGPEGLEVNNGWVRLMPPVSKNTAGYLEVTNHGDEADYLFAVHADFVRAAELHTMEADDEGVRMMRPLHCIEIPAGETIRLESGEKHLMLIGLKKALQEDEMVDVILEFKKAGKIGAKLLVRKGV